MFRVLFFAIVSTTLAVNLVLLFATKDKPPDGQLASGSPPTTSGFESVINQVDFSSWRPAARQPVRRLFLRSNDMYDLHDGEQISTSSQTSPSRTSPPQGDHSSEPTGGGGGGGGRTRVETRAESEPLDREISSGGSHSRQLADTGAEAATTTTTEMSRQQGRRQAAPNSTNTLAIRVKSSKNHVLITVDNLIIYESGALEAAASKGNSAFRRRPVRRAASAPGGAGWRVQALEKRAHTTERPDHSERQDQAGQEPDRQRGLHVLVLNQFEGFVMSRRRFDTYSPGQDEELALYLGQVQPGRLLVLAVQDEASFKMARSSPARKLIAAALGSRLISQLDWRDMWALVAVKQPEELEATNRRFGSGSGGPALAPSGAGCEPLAEGLSKARDFADWAPPVELEATFQLVAASGRSQSGCDWQRDSGEARTRRRHFCDRIEGYGRVCDCSRPSPIEFAPRPLANSQLTDVPIVVVASNRPYYLYRMLRSLLQADGIEPGQVTVFIDGFYEEPRALCELLHVRHVQTRPEATRSARISHHYKTSLTHTFERLFPRAQFAIVLEEDLDLARDALIYFNQTRGLLERDPSLYCVSAWNDQGYEHSAGDPRQLLRVETMPGLGWMLTRRLFEEELKARWPSSRQQHDWDMWIRTAAVRRGRECIIPEMSRTFHFGSLGTNINSYFQQQYFSKHAFSDFALRPSELKGLQFNQLDQLEAPAYDQTIEQLLTGADPRRRWFTPGLADEPDSQNHPHNNLFKNETLAIVSSAALCALAGEPGASQPMQPGDSKTLNVILINMIDADDFVNWLRLAKCWRLWDLDARGQHKSMWRLRLRNQPTLIIGHPASPFSRLRPGQVLAYDLRRELPAN